MLFSLQQIGSAHQFIYSTHTQCCHIFPQLLCDKFHKVFHIFRLTAEVFPQLRVLGSHAYWAGIQITYSHHDTAHGHKRCGGKPELLGT